MNLFDHIGTQLAGEDGLYMYYVHVRSCNNESPEVIVSVNMTKHSPGIHTVEGDFSILKRTNETHRGRLSDYAVEGEPQSTSRRCEGSGQKATLR
ncbi:hypothetical protein PPTG_23708 [Phytophthora nicotianae INRA-310]|uniref:Uncharacterized protein n=2 Tax=Phytophthora nicotianae TaxID=4792 RepID=W2PV14_PHYN3|nr:hypothetical protein PPTG_23708 [Phytophthora nicotianae INRA-310]ETN03865.1 hypothetical protein PPTG_23708 [Phytophthora nicotianae INRA-310]